jgi:hypothetical protein
MMAGAVCMSHMPLRWRAAPKVEEEFDLVVQSAADFVADVRQSSAQRIGRRAADDACAEARRAKARGLDGRGVRTETSTLRPLNPKWEKKALDAFPAGRLDQLDGARIDSDITELPGCGAHGVRTWIAGLSSHRPEGPDADVFFYAFYAPIDEWTAGTSVMTARRTRLC